MSTTTLHVKGMHCGSCVERVRGIISESTGVTSTISLSDEIVVLNSTSPEITSSVISSLNKAGYATTKEEPKKSIRLETRLLIGILGTLPLLLHMFSSEPIFHNPYFQLAFSVPVFAVGIPFFLPGAIGSIRTREPNMDLLVIMAVFAGITASVWGIISNDHSKIFLEPAASILTIVLLGSVIERRAFKKADDALELLGEKNSTKAKIIRLQNGIQTTEEVSASSVSKGDRVIVELGNSIPQDGIIESGSAEVNESILTGESFPVLREVGDKVIGGSIVTSGNLVIKVTATSETSFYAHLTNLVREARNSRPKFQKLLDKVVAWFVPIVILVALGIIVGGPLIFNLTFSDSLSRALAVLVIACPCAIGLATPVALSVGLGTAARKGILFRDLDSIISLSKVKNLLFDKTGTLTNTELTVQSIQEYSSLTDLASRAHTVASRSTHPASKAVVKHFKDSPQLELHTVSETPGVGIRGVFADGIEVSIGSKKLLKNPEEQLEHSLYITSQGKIIAGVNLSETVRSDAKESIEALNKLGVTSILATGDKKDRADEIAGALGVSSIHSSLTPEDKLSLLRSFDSSGVTGFVGDGVNDAPVLSGASVGIAVSDASLIAKSSAHLMLLKPGLRGVIDAIKLSKKMKLIINQNIFWAFIYNIIAIPLAASGNVSPIIGALTMVLSDVCVVGNALRLRKL